MHERSQVRIARITGHLLGERKDHLSTNVCVNPHTHNVRDLTPKSIVHSKKPEYVFFGWRTVMDSEMAAVTNMYGECELVQGPQSKFIFRKNFEPLERITAHPGEYVIIEYKNGEKEHVPGPTSVFFDPVKHNKISLGKSVIINTGQAIVIYGKDEKGNVTTEVAHGPSVRVLKSNEWLHQFYWKVPDQTNPSIATKQLIKFVKLRTIPDQFYFNVAEVRTSDDAVLTVKLMIFYHLKDVNKMLHATHDPAAEFINGATADVIDFASCRTFEEFKRDSEQLNRIETFHQLNSRIPSLGYEVTKVIYRGYDASLALQHMHEKAIETRTQIRLKTESEKQEQELENYRLQCKQQRTTQELELERQKVEHTRAMSEITHNDLLRKQKAEHEESIRQKQVTAQLEYNALQRKQELEIGHKEKTNKIAADYYKKLHSEADVDITKFLVAQHTNFDKSIKLVGNSSNPRVRLNLDGDK